ncbi:LOW QUALITY PROTEIN: hypothetical protein N665_0406s0004 [Sinapis alba]|nr:LOW QUALITY PROTEIN: hypothetical protein N665_0406s0004 [Sinapis alba]
MELLQLRMRMFTLGLEPIPLKIIAYHTDDPKLRPAVKHLTGLNYKYIENLDNQAVEVTNELARFWEMMGVDIDVGPSSEQIIAACKRLGEWSRDDEKKYSSATRDSPARLVMDLEEFETYPWGRLAFKFVMDFVKGKDLTRFYTIYGFIQFLQVWIYFALPNFVTNFGKFIQNKPSLKGHKGPKFVKKAINTLVSVIIPNSITCVVNYVPKDIGTNLLTNPKVLYVKEESLKQTVKEERGARKKARTKAHTMDSIKAPTDLLLLEMKEEIEQMFKDLTKVMTDGFGQCAKEMKLLADIMEAVEKKVGINHKCIDSSELQLTLSDPAKPVHEPGINKEEGSRQIKKDDVMALCCGKSDRETKIDVSYQSLFQGNNTAKLIVPTKKHCKTDRLFFLDHLFGWMWTSKYGRFKSSKAGIKNLGGRLFVGSWDLYPVLVPKYCQTKKIWGSEVDDIYVPVNYKNNHWIAIWISIANKHITIWDIILSHIKTAELAYLMEPFTTMIPYLLVECAASDENVDCGVYALKYIECHTHGMPLFPSAFCGMNVKGIREKMVMEIFHHDLDYHGAETKEHDGLDMYD